MPRKTNKTSHVLNLITNGGASEQEDAADEKKEAAVKDAAGEETSGKDASAEEAAAKDTSVKEATVKEATAKETSDKEAAARETEAGETASKEAAVKEAVSKESSARETETGEAASKESASKATVSKETAQEGTNLKEPVSRITATGDKTVIVVNDTSQNNNISSKILDRLTDQLEEEIQGKLDYYHMVNVMEQILMRMNLKHYMKQYDVCMCSRCQADVMALILTRLPAKYVVVDESSTAPIIGFYESKFKVRILTEIIKACMDVKDNPRHDRSGPYDK